jgi:hypothetical protein
MKKSTVITLAAIVSLLVIGYVFRGALYAQMDSLKLLPREKGVTELYFDDFNQLSVRLPRRINTRTRVSFTFAVHNAQNTAIEIPYEVQVITDGTTITFERGTLMLDEGEVEIIPVTYIFKLPHTKAKFVVLLPESNQAIHFFVPKQ